MYQPFKAVKISEHVYWVGAIDWAIEEFHGYKTSRGTTYNAFLVMADKITLIDTVKAPFKNELLSRIASVIEPEKIDYIISNHSEMDHSGCLPEVIESVKPEKVFASVAGVDALSRHFNLKMDISPVKHGENVSLGNVSLTFFDAKMLHWPESMFTWMAEDGILFSQDAFGMHLATSKLFNDEIDENILRWEAAKYYANILLPFSPIVAKQIKKMGELNLPIKMLATDHGPIWRKDIEKILSLYSEWSVMKPAQKAVIIYDTMWQSTAKMSQAIVDGLMEENVEIKVMCLASKHRSDIATEILEAGALIVGSPTINNNIFPTVADVLTYLKGLKRRNLIGAAFGSYGWSGDAVKQLNQILEEMKVKIIHPGLNVKYVPKELELEQCADLGRQIGKALKEV